VSACDSVRERLVEAASGADDPIVRAHVQSCGECRAELEDLRAILEAPDAGMDPPPRTEAPRLVRDDLEAIGILRRRAPAIVAGAVATAAILFPVLVAIHARRDLAELPRGFLYSSVAMQVVLGATGILLATRLSALSRTLAGVFAGLSAALFIGFAVAMPSGPSSLVPLPGADTVWHMVPCYLVATIHGVLPVGLTAWLLSRARFFPVAASVCAGIGAGLLSTPAVEMICPVSVTSHVLVAHGGAVVTVIAISLLAFRSLEARRRTA